MNITHGHQALLISVQPRFAEMIFDETKTVELRRVKPRVEKGGVVFVYVSSPVMALQGAFEVDEVVCDSPRSIWRQFNGGCGLSKAEFDTYYCGKQKAFAIRIRKAWRLQMPVELANLRKYKKGFHPPQSYHYICRQAFSHIEGFETEARKN